MQELRSSRPQRAGEDFKKVKKVEASNDFFLFIASLFGWWITSHNVLHDAHDMADDMAPEPAHVSKRPKRCPEARTLESKTFQEFIERCVCFSLILLCGKKKKSFLTKIYMCRTWLLSCGNRSTNQSSPSLFLPTQADEQHPRLRRWRQGAQVSEGARDIHTPPSPPHTRFSKLEVGISVAPSPPSQSLTLSLSPSLSHTHSLLLSLSRTRTLKG